MKNINKMPGLMLIIAIFTVPLFLAAEKVSAQEVVVNVNNYTVIPYGYYVYEPDTKYDCANCLPYKQTFTTFTPFTPVTPAEAKNGGFIIQPVRRQAW